MLKSVFIKYFKKVSSVFALFWFYSMPINCEMLKMIWDSKI